jgi:hypothetical protein
MRLRLLQQGKDLLPLHTGKTLEKVCNGVTGLKMVKQTLVDFLSNLPEPFPYPKGISAQIQDVVNPNQLLVALKTIKNRERKSLRQSSVKTEN